MNVSVLCFVFCGVIFFNIFAKKLKKVSDDKYALDNNFVCCFYQLNKLQVYAKREKTNR